MGTLDDKSPLSLYFQLKEILIEMIHKKELKFGEKIPTELELCAQFGVSRITVRQALAELEKEGYLIRKQGKGTFVSFPEIEQNLTSFYSFSEEFKKMGFQPSVEVLEFNLIIATPKISEILKLDESKLKVYYFKRLRYADKILIAIESTYIPQHLFPNLQESHIKEKPLYNVMREDYGIVPNSAEESIGATMISEKESFYFGFKKGTPAMSIERLTYRNSECVEYTYGIIRGDKFKFKVKLS